MPYAQGGNALRDVVINLASMAPVLTQPCSTPQVFDALEKIFLREGIRIMTLLSLTE